MAGIVFFKTRELEKIKEFYMSTLEMSVWLDQGDCIILKKGNLLLGFCQREGTGTDTQGMITFFYPEKGDVDAVYGKIKDRAQGKPVKNGKYRIYQFFARDPENRILEFQCFLHPLAPIIEGDELKKFYGE